MGPLRWRKKSFGVSCFRSTLVVEVFDERLQKKFRSVKASGLKASLTSEEPAVTFDIEM